MSDKWFNCIIAVPFFIWMAINFYHAIADRAAIDDALSLRAGVLDVMGAGR